MVCYSRKVFNVSVAQSKHILGIILSNIDTLAENNID